jgi:hypothetical protein
VFKLNITYQNVVVSAIPAGRGKDGTPNRHDGKSTITLRTGATDQ